MKCPRHTSGRRDLPPVRRITVAATLVTLVTLLHHKVALFFPISELYSLGGSRHVHPTPNSSDNRRTQLPFLPRFFTSSAHAEIAADPPHVPAWLLQLWPPAAPSGAPGLPAHGSGGEVVSGHRGGICDSGVTWSPLQFRAETPAVPHCFHLRPHVPANHARDRVPTYAHVLLPIRYTRMRTYAYIPVGTRA